MDKMRVQSRGWACAGDADTGRGCWAADAFMDFARASGAMFENKEAIRGSEQLEKKPRQPMEHQRRRCLQHHRA